MTRPLPSAPATPAQFLAGKVVETLTAAGVGLANLGDGQDGFDVLRSVAGPQDHVLVVARHEGPMADMGTPNVRHQNLARWGAVLDGAGFTVRHHDHDGFTIALVVGVDDQTAEHALATLRTPRGGGE